MFFTKKIDKSKVERILFITLTNVGDAILTMPVLEALSLQFTNARIDVLAHPNVIELFEKDKRVSKVFSYDKRSGVFEKYRLLKKLFFMKYDLIIDLKNTMIPMFLMPKFRTKYYISKKLKQHKKNEHLYRIKQLGVNIENADFIIDIDKIDRQKSLELIYGYTSPGKYVVVNAGAKSHTKRWNPLKYSQLCDRIITEMGLGVILIGRNDGLKNPDSDRVVINKVIAGMKKKPLDLVGKTNICQTISIIESAKAIVTNDSAPLHMASAVNTPVVAIFGPTDEKKYGPLSDKNIIVNFKIKCRPCMKPQCDKNLKCLENIQVSEVYDALKFICES